MATIITQNNPLIPTNVTYRDLDLRFNVHPVKRDVTKHLNEYAVINSVKNLVFTNFYEKPFNPNFGSNVRALLFEPLDEITSTHLERAITEVITNYEPRVSVTEVVADPIPDENRYNVKLTFYILNSQDTITINFFLERIR
jgi:phage baseplate assembly protein W